MYLRADIDLVPGQSATLNQCMTEFLLPKALEAGWQLVISLRQNENENKVTNIWNVGDNFNEGIELMRHDKNYDKYKTLLAQCIANETHTMCETWM